MTRTLGALTTLLLLIGAIAWHSERGANDVTVVESLATKSNSVTQEIGSAHVAASQGVSPEVTSEAPRGATSSFNFKAARDRLATFKDAERAIKTEDIEHSAPRAVLESGQTLGRILEEADQASAIRGEALEFFTSCAEDTSLIMPVRAHCLSALVRSVRKWKMFVAVSEVKADDEIRALAARFPIPVN